MVFLAGFLEGLAPTSMEVPEMDPGDAADGDADERQGKFEEGEEKRHRIG